MAKILKTSELVTTALRRASIPAEESAFTTQDIIDILNEEMQSYIMPIIMRLHEDFYLYDEPITIIDDQTTYKIPYRATGNKLYDVIFRDPNNNLYETVRLTPGSRMEYSGKYRAQTRYKYFLKSDSVVFLDNNIKANHGSFIFSYFLRPNNLVKDNRGSQVVSISNDLQSATVTDYVNIIGDTIVIGGFTFTAVSGAPASTKQFQAITDNNVTAQNLINAINSDVDSSAIVVATRENNVITIRDLNGATLSVSVDSDSMTLDVLKKEIFIDEFPTHFASTSVFDIVQGTSPSTISAFDISGTPISGAGKYVILNKADLPDTFAIGDYIMAKEETVVAQIPTELQPLLAQKTACKLLESLGDADGMKMATAELERLERNLNTLIDTRVDESVVKAHNRHTSLREFTHGRGYNRGY